MFERTRLVKMAGAMALVAATVLLFSALAGSGADAAKGGNGNGRGSNTNVTNAACSVTPNPASIYSEVSITGSGFAPNVFYGLTVANSDGTVALTSVGSDASGSVSTTYNTVWKGTNTVNISGAGFSATCTFQVN